ncbi:Ig-like domain-containing protein [bacterium]|nr:Ig-like domain-containing protein [bacterium]
MKMNKFILTSFAALSGMLFTGCAVDDTRTGEGPIVDTSKFYVVDFTPGYDTTTSDETAQIVAVFSMPVDVGSLIGNFSLTQDINGIPTNLTQCLTLSVDSTGSIVTFHINPDDNPSTPCPSTQPLADRADYTFSVNQTVRPLGLNMALTTPISHKFNTGGGFENSDGGVTVPGKPYIISRNYIRQCFIDASGQEIHTAHIEVRFNEDLAFAPTVDVQVVNDFANNYQNLPMTQLQGGDMSIMKIVVPSVGGIQGYKIRFGSNYVRDLEGLFMDSYESSGMYQAVVQCH